MCRAQRPIVWMRDVVLAKLLLCPHPKWPQRHFRQIQASRSRLIPDEHVNSPRRKFAQDLIGQRSTSNANSGTSRQSRKIFGQIFRHALGQCGYQHAFVFLRAHTNFFQKIVHLAFTERISTCGSTSPLANHLFDDHAAGLGELIRPGRCGDVNDLIDAMLNSSKVKGRLSRAEGIRKP